MKLQVSLGAEAPSRDLGAGGYGSRMWNCEAYWLCLIDENVAQLPSSGHAVERSEREAARGRLDEERLSINLSLDTANPDRT